MLCVFSVLHHNSVLFVLAWTLTFQEAIHALFDAVAKRQPVGQDARTLLAAAAAPLGAQPAAGQAGPAGDAGEVCGVAL